ncbi:MAG: hypothetical protein WHX52_12335 [Anaerolineae bacterium]
MGATPARFATSRIVAMDQIAEQDMVPFSWYAYHITTETFQCQEGNLVITHISPRSTLRPQRDKKVFSARFATSAVNEPARLVHQMGNHQGNGDWQAQS